MTRTELLAENLAEFRQRFGTLHDAVIHSFHYHLFSVSEPQKISVVVGTHDWQAQTDDNWLNLTFAIEDITTLVLKSPKNYYSGIVFSLGIGFFDGEIHLNFMDCSDSDDLECYEDKLEQQGSKFIVVGKRCFWSTSRYIERGSTEYS